MKEVAVHVFLSWMCTILRTDMGSSKAVLDTSSAAASTGSTTSAWSRVSNAVWDHRGHIAVAVVGSLAAYGFSKMVKYFRWYRHDVDDLKKRLDEERTARAHAETVRTAEREGRIRAEKRVKELLLLHGDAEDSGRHPSWKFQPIGCVQSVFRGRHGTPRQGCCVPEARALLKLTGGNVEPRGALSNLAEFEYVWLIYVFHENTNFGANLKARVAPPRLKNKRVGLFSTRSPHRPCPIGLSLVRLISVDGDTVLLGGVDLVDGTPVLDIKPYIPSYDCPVELSTSFRLPGWISEEPVLKPMDAVYTSPRATESLQKLFQRKRKMIRMYRSTEEFEEFLGQVLLHDIRSEHQRVVCEDSRTSNCCTRYCIFVEQVRVDFIYAERAHVIIVDVIATSNAIPEAEVEVDKNLLPSIDSCRLVSTRPVHDLAHAGSDA